MPHPNSLLLSGSKNFQLTSTRMLTHDKAPSFSVSVRTIEVTSFVGIPYTFLAFCCLSFVVLDTLLSFCGMVKPT